MTHSTQAVIFGGMKCYYAACICERGLAVVLPACTARRPSHFHVLILACLEQEPRCGTLTVAVCAVQSWSA